MSLIITTASAAALGGAFGAMTVAAAWRWSTRRRRLVSDSASSDTADLARRNEDYFRLLIQHASDIITVVGNDGTLRFASPAAERLMGWRPEEIEGRAVREFVHPEDAEPMFALVARARAERDGVMIGKFRFRQRDGAWRMLEGTGRIGEDRDGAEIAIVDLRDVTERDALQARLMHANKMESIGRLAGGIAHDFNNLLTGILASTEMARELLPADHAAGPDLAEILRASARASELTRQLLAFARLDISRPLVIDVNAMVTDLSMLLRRLLGESIALEISLGDHVPCVMADISQLEQVLVNLAVNARDAMPGGGTLSIRTRREEVGPLAVLEGAEIACVVLEVEDTGVGMSEEVRRRLFEPFFTTKSPGRGTGLGLATCYGIVVAHGGRIEVESRPNDGARFRLTLPVTNAPLPDEPPKSRVLVAPARSAGGETILLVEDDEDVREVTGRALRRAGYTVLEATDGVSALALLEEHQTAIDLLVTDVVLPHMSGAELAIRARPRWPKLDMLFTSGYPGDSIDLSAVTRLGIPLLSKPYTSAILLFEVRLRLDASRHHSLEPHVRLPNAAAEQA